MDRGAGHAGSRRVSGGGGASCHGGLGSTGGAAAVVALQCGTLSSPESIHPPLEEVATVDSRPRRRLLPLELSSHILGGALRRRGRQLQAHRRRRACLSERDDVVPAAAAWHKDALPRHIQLPAGQQVGQRGRRARRVKGLRRSSVAGAGARKSEHEAGGGAATRAAATAADAPPQAAGPCRQNARYLPSGTAGLYSAGPRGRLHPRAAPCSARQLPKRVGCGPGVAWLQRRAPPGAGQPACRRSGETSSGERGGGLFSAAAAAALHDA